MKIYKKLTLLALFLLITTAYAGPKKGKIEVLAKNIDSSKTTATASDGVVVYYNNSTIKAQSASYNKETKVLVLDGKVEVIGYQGTKEHTDHMEIYTEDNEVKFEKLFFVTQNDIWLYSSEGHRSEGNYTLGESILSSCDISNPLWKMLFTNSKYDSEKEYMKIYNAKVYLWDVPIFYSPYFAFSTNKQRSSGLLSPRFGYMAEEGFIYEQPIFWAISPSMDLELDPQIRTKRSKGAYGTFRFVDSNHSSGKLRIGYFKDSEEYQEQEKTKELKHYGAEFLYDSSSLFVNSSSGSLKDGLYINATYLSDIDYLNLQKSPIHFGRRPVQESRLNYFLHNDNYYAGINAKYFIDTRKKNDDSTLQVLPAIQLHKYLNHIFWKNITYSVDIHVDNFSRKTGATMKQVELKVPLDFTTSLFADYLNISLGEDFFYSKHFFANGEYIHDNFQNYYNIHRAKLFTDLTRKYDNYVHIVQPSIKYIKPGKQNESPVEFDKMGKQQKKLFSADLPEEQYSIGFNQYLYSASKTSLKFFQRFHQIYYPNRKDKWSDLENEMMYSWRKWILYNSIIYSPKFSEIREMSNFISLREKRYNFTLEHTHQKKFINKSKTKISNDIDFRFRYDLNNRIGISGELSYDVENSNSTQWQLGASYSRDCWSVSASVRQDITPRPTGSTKDNIYYLNLNFIPFGGIGTDSLSEGKR